jgi:hypothetical protein
MIEMVLRFLCTSVPMHLRSLTPLLLYTFNPSAGWEIL